MCRSIKVLRNPEMPATGAEIEFADRDTVERVVARIGDDGYPIRTMIHEVVQSDLFRSR